MRKLVLFALIVFCSTFVFAQKANVKDAKSYLGSGKLDEAKKAIDKAVVDTGSIKWSETWFLKGKIYQQIAESLLPMYRVLDKDSIAAYKSFEAYLKAMEISKTEKKDKYKKDVIQLLIGLKTSLISEGSTAYNNSKYDKAYMYFSSSVAIDKLPDVNLKDTIVIYYTGLAALNTKKWDEAINYFDQANILKLKEPRIYINIANAYKGKGDTVKSVKVLQEGIEKYPNDNINLINELINHYLVTGQNKDAHKFLDLAIEKDPKNESYYFAKGTLYDKELNVEKAMEFYKKSTQVNEKYFNGYYNLGALYFNKAVKILGEADKLPLNESAKYEIELKKSEEQFKVALPLMEKASEIDPKDISTLQTLSTLYLKLNMPDKQKLMKERIDALQPKQ